MAKLIGIAHCFFAESAFLQTVQFAMVNAQASIESAMPIAMISQTDIIKIPLKILVI
jgi:hypothetical protein